jgi:hypothetical protein
MGNFSRNTFDPQQNYVAVRLQQGVPVLDADWNELNDVTRQELYDTFSLTFTDGIQPGGFDFEVGSSEEPNDFKVLAGAALIQGRAVRVRKNLRYTTQPWTNPQRAARDGVAVIPPLTTPPGPPERIDIVYLDAWDREVASDEDANLINPAIGVETCVRLKREAAVRVAEGRETLPTAPAGHAFLPLALLRRPRNQAQIQSRNIESIRPYFHSPLGTGIVSFFPGFLPIQQGQDPTQTLPEWRIGISPTGPGPGEAIPKFRAVKPQNQAVSGILPLTLPDRARLRSFAIRGDISAVNGVVQWLLLRFRHQVPTASSTETFFDILAEDVIQAASAGHVFDRTYDFSSDEANLIVDNSRYYYALLTHTGMVPGGYVASIHGISISYEYYGLAGAPTNPGTRLTRGSNGKEESHD